MHLFFITVIIVISYLLVYRAWFKNDAVKQYERGFIPGPKSLRGYVIWYKAWVILVWLFAVALYVITIIGVFK